MELRKQSLNKITTFLLCGCVIHVSHNITIRTASRRTRHAPLFEAAYAQPLLSDYALPQAHGSCAGTWTMRRKLCTPTFVHLNPLNIRTLCLGFQHVWHKACTPAQSVRCEPARRRCTCRADYISTCGPWPKSSPCHASRGRTQL